jgi:hypothetical protein
MNCFVPGQSRQAGSPSKKQAEFGDLWRLLLFFWNLSHVFPSSSDIPKRACNCCNRENRHKTQRLQSRNSRSNFNSRNAFLIFCEDLFVLFLCFVGRASLPAPPWGPSPVTVVKQGVDNRLTINMSRVLKQGQFLVSAYSMPNGNSC